MNGKTARILREYTMQIPNEYKKEKINWGKLKRTDKNKKRKEMLAFIKSNK
jgi:hypothetical protein